MRLCLSSFLIFIIIAGVEVYRWDPGSSLWWQVYPTVEARPAGQLEGRCEHTCCYYNGKIFMYGGRCDHNQKLFQDMACYDTGQSICLATSISILIVSWVLSTSGGSFPPPQKQLTQILLTGSPITQWFQKEGVWEQDFLWTEPWLPFMMTFIHK